MLKYYPQYLKKPSNFYNFFPSIRKETSLRNNLLLLSVERYSKLSCKSQNACAGGCVLHTSEEKSARVCVSSARCIGLCK
jgi:hypothetical protein